MIQDVGVTVLKTIRTTEKYFEKKKKKKAKLRHAKTSWKYYAERMGFPHTSLNTPPFIISSCRGRGYA